MIDPLSAPLTPACSAAEAEGPPAGAPAASAALYETGCDLDDAGDHAAAVGWFRAAAEAGDPDGWLAAGNCLYALDRDAEAAAAYAAAARAGVDEALLNLGLALEATGDVLGAEDAYRRARAARDPRAASFLAHLWRWHGRRDEALALLRDAAADGDDHAAGELGVWLVADGSVAGAGDDVEALLRQGAPVDLDAASDLAWLLRRRGRPGDVAELEALLRAGAAAGHHDSEVRWAIVLEEDHHDPAAAEVVLRRAADAGELFAWANLGLLLRDRGDLLGAQAAFRRGAAGGDALAVRHLAGLRRDHRRQLGRAVRRQRRGGWAAARRDGEPLDPAVREP